MPIGAITAGLSGFGAYKASRAASKANKAAQGQLGETKQQGNLLNETARMQQEAGKPFLSGGQRSVEQGQRMVSGSALNPDFEQAAGYYRNILSGDRAAAAGALAPDIAAITENYRGAERNAQSTLRGGQRDLALAELNRDRVGKTAGLRAQLRPGAAAALSDIGRFRVGAGQAQQGMGLNQAQVGANLLTGSAQTQGTVYGGMQNLYGIQNQNAQQAAAYANQAGSAFGNTLIGLLGSIPGLGKGGGGRVPSPAASLPGYGQTIYSPIIPGSTFSRRP